MYGRHCRERLYVIKCPVWIFFYSLLLKLTQTPTVNDCKSHMH